MQNAGRPILIAITALLSAVPLYGSASPLAAQVETGAIQGTVMQVGTKEGISEVQVMITGRSSIPNASVIQSLVFDATLAGIPLSPGELNAGTLDLLQSQIDAAAVKGIERSREFQKVLNGLRSSDGQFATISDGEGHFSIPNVPAGVYTLRAQREGYFGSSFRGTTPLAFTTSITVTAKQTTQVAVSMLAGGTISGVVRDESGDPSSNSSVQAFSVTYQNGFPILAPAVSKVTNDIGEFRLFWLPPGNYYVGATGQPPPKTQPGEPTTAPPALVTYYPSTLDVKTGTALEVKGGGPLEDIRISLRPPKLPKISGQINSRVPAVSLQNSQSAIGGNAAAPPVVLMMLQSDVNTPDNISARVVGTFNLNDNIGRFEVPNILPGSYDLYARTEDFEGGTPFLGRAYDWGHTQIVVGDRDVDGISINLHPSLPVKGNVTVDGGAPKNPVRIAIEADGTAVKLGAYQMYVQRPVPTEASGSFTIAGISEGHFRISAPGLPPQFYLADVRQTVSVFDSGFDIGSEVPGSIEVEIRSGAGTIEGTAQGDRQEPVPGAVVVAVPAATARRANRMLYHTATSDAKGHYSISGLAPGEYKVFAWDGLAGGAYYNSTFLSRYEDRGKSARVLQGSPTNLDVLVLSEFPTAH
ncbi:MAG TPA: carboxypeptidase regulatory-like domain-containing protein [Terriglobia bacterium]|nr:carboxypeptidase regulatory-like domain-containing protein [Terriglobia bacterium]